ncbi:MAG TPA: Rrf2 family transcriptional regulator [Ktedonobacterales bacterium]
MRIGTSHGPGWFSVAVQALVVLAESDAPCPSSVMAQDLKSHAVHVRRVLAQLVRAHLIQAREGRAGGYRLARSADQITLAEVYQAVAVADPAEHPAGAGGVNARVQGVLDGIGAEAEDYLLELLSHHTLASVVKRVASEGRPS